MSAAENLNNIRAEWINRVANRLARGAGLRETFQEQLEKFYDLFLTAVESEDPSRLDPILHDWAVSFTQTDLREGEKSITSILNQMLMITYELSREKFGLQDGMELIGAILPVLTFSLEKASQYELDARVATISNDLSGAQKKLERLDKSKSNFISIAAHELKTPLTLIEGYTAMMRERVLNGQNDQLDALIEGVNNGIRRLRTIVDDMIDVSLINNDLLSLNFQPVWINQILGLISNELNDSLTRRNQVLEIRAFPGCDQMLFGDPERLYQAFHNILSNAIKFTPDGGRIIVDGRRLPGFMEVTVADNGIGISPKDQEAIFMNFGQLGNKSLHSSGKVKFKGGGPGLGLPIAKGIFEAHKGAIWVESLGHNEKTCPGSTFHVLLPIHTEPSNQLIARLFSVKIKSGQGQ